MYIFVENVAGPGTHIKRCRNIAQGATKLTSKGHHNQYFFMSTVASTVVQDGDPEMDTRKNA